MNSTAPAPPLYQLILSDEDWNALPAPIRAMHDHRAGWQAAGIASVERGNSILARMTAAVMAFPQAADNIPVKVVFQVSAHSELWRRTFGKPPDSKFFSSWQYRGRSGLPGALCERFGPFSFDITLRLEDERLFLDVHGWRFLGLPLPARFAPSGNTYESAEDDRFNFHVEIAHPFTGLIVRYRGWLALA